jgi:hypothetical protein
MAPRSHQLTRALLAASALLLALLGGVPAEPAHGWELPVPAIDGALHLEDAAGEVHDAFAPTALAAQRLAAVLAGPAAITLALVLRRRRTPTSTPWEPDVWPGPANRAPPVAGA